MRGTDEGSASEAPISTSSSAVHLPRLGITFPPVKESGEIINEKQQQAAVSQKDIRKDMENDIPPVIRSVLELSHLTMTGHSQWLRATPGYQGGLLYKGKPFCFSSGYRDSTRPLDAEDKGNHMKLKDPLVYGTLSLPITAAYICELHGKGIFSLERPLAHYLPELHEKLGNDVTARHILSFTRVVRDSEVLKDAGASAWQPLLSWNSCAATQSFIYEPLNRFLAGGAATTVLDGRQQRANLVQYLRSAPRFTSLSTVARHRARPSHFSIALLLAAVETQLHGRSFEEDIRQVFFERSQSHGAGYGPPKLWRDPNEMFYQPTGLALQHQGFKRPVPANSEWNAAPAVWNGSMNLYAPVEDYGKLLLLSIDTVVDARKVLGTPDDEKRPYYDFGMQYVPSKQQLVLRRSVLHGVDFIPSAASLRYSCDHDLGCFGISSCGSRSGRIFANNLSRMIQHLFLKHVLGKGVRPEEPINLDDPMRSGSETEEKFKKIMKDQELTSYFKKTDAHRRF